MRRARALIWGLGLTLGLGGCSPSAWVNYPSSTPAGYYVVQRGDTLYSIAWRAGRDYRSLANWNGIGRPYRIYPGQRLRVVPIRGDRPMAKAAPTPARPRVSGPPASWKAPAPRSLVKGAVAWRWPTQGRVVKRFAASTPGKKGVDIAGKIGQPIVAASAGRVVYTGSGLIGYGRLIIVKHNDEYLSAYGYNRRVLVKEGQQVSAGQLIAEMGAIGTDQPRLHFEIRREGDPIDPLKQLPRGKRR